MGGSRTSTSTTTQELSPEQRQLINLVIPQAEEMMRNPPTLYNDAPPVAPFNYLQEQAQEMGQGVAYNTVQPMVDQALAGHNALQEGALPAGLSGLGATGAAGLQGSTALGTIAGAGAGHSALDAYANTTPGQTGLGNLTSGGNVGIRNLINGGDSTAYTGLLRQLTTGNPQREVEAFAGSYDPNANFTQQLADAGGSAVSGVQGLGSGNDGTAALGQFANSVDPSILQGIAGLDINGLAPWANYDPASIAALSQDTGGFDALLGFASNNQGAAGSSALASNTQGQQALGDLISGAGAGGDLSSLLGSNVQNAQGAQDFLLSGDVLSPDSNPYLKQTADAAVGSLADTLNNEVLPNIRRGATSAGQYGSTRQGIAEGLAIQDFLGEAGNVSADIYSGGYGQGLDAYSGALRDALNTSTAAGGALLGSAGDAGNTLFQGQTGAIGDLLSAQRQSGSDLLSTQLQAGNNLAQIAQLAASGQLTNTRLAGTDLLGLGQQSGSDLLDASMAANLGLLDASAGADLAQMNTASGASQSLLDAGVSAGNSFLDNSLASNQTIVDAALGAGTAMQGGAIDAGSTQLNAGTTAASSLFDGGTSAFSSLLGQGVDSLNSTADNARLALTPAQILDAIGQQQQGQTQSETSALADQHLIQQMMPFMMAQDVANLAFGIPAGTTVSTGTSPGPDPLTQILGLGMMFAGMPFGGGFGGLGGLL